MKTYAALGEKSGYVGAISDCVSWALDSVDKGLEPVYQIIRCRAGEPEAKVIAQVHENGIEHLEEPIYISISRFIDGAEPIV